MTDDFLGKIQAIIKPVKHLKIGNCGESSLLSAIIAKTNGIKNCYPATIKSPYGDSFDHAVLYVADEKPYIIDAWLGFADYLPEAIQRYTKDFHDNFDFEKFETEKMIFCSADYLYCFNFFEHNFTKSNISQIIQKYPNFLIKKNQ